MSEKSLEGSSMANRTYPNTLAFSPFADEGHACIRRRSSRLSHWLSPPAWASFDRPLTGMFGGFLCLWARKVWMYYYYSCNIPTWYLYALAVTVSCELTHLKAMMCASSDSSLLCCSVPVAYTCRWWWSKLLLVSSV